MSASANVRSDTTSTSQSNASNTSTTSPSSTHETSLADPSLKWGRTLKTSSSNTDTKSHTQEKPDFATFYSEEEQAALRAKGINPTLKAEMEWAKANSQGRGFWGKLAGTAMGGGWIK